MSKVRQKVQEMVGMTLQSAVTERAETVSRSSPERRVRFSPEVQIEQRQGFGIKNPLKRSGIVMSASDKWLNEENVVVNKKPKAPKKSRKPKKPKVTQASGSPRKVTIVLSGAPDENIVLKRPASQDQSEVVVKKVTPEKTIVVTEESGQQRKSRKLSLRPVCYMKNCSVLVSHFHRHVIGKHLPVSFAVWKMSPQRRMDSISSFLNSIEDVVGVQSHDELLKLVVRNKWFPTRIGVKKFEEDDKLVCEFHHWCTGKELKEHPTISPPNCVGSLAHWRLIRTVLSHVGEEKVPQVDLAPSPKEIEVSESNSKAVEPGVDVVENFVDNTAAVDTRPATFPTEEQVEELLGTATEELMETADSSILDEPKMVEERPSDVGRPYTYDMWKTRRDALFNSKSSERLPFVDSHMHLDKLQNTSKRQDLCEIMKHGPMPSELVELKFAVANFCHGVPTKQARERAYKDKRIYTTYGVHPKQAHVVTKDDMERVKIAILRDPRCVGIGEIGIDLSGSFGRHKEAQVKVLREILKFYAEEELWDKVLVFHCRDEHLSTEASDLCLQILKEEVPSFDKDMVEIHRHCYTGDWDEVQRWTTEFRHTKFGFTGLLLRHFRHPGLDEVVKRLETHQLLLETDSPYLLPPEHNRCEYNTPYGIVNVAIRIADLRYQNLKEILDITTTNAMELYKLK